MSLKLIISITAALLLAGCASQTFLMDGRGASLVTPTEEITQHFFIGGIGQEQVLNAGAICGGAEKYS